MDDILTPHWFWNRVDMTGGADACWPWLGNIVSDDDPYGRFYISGDGHGAHRFAILISKGPPPRSSPLACHTCDNPPCCNPKHLWWGSHKENNEDCCQKGRKIAPSRRKIDRKEAMRLRHEGWSYKELAAHFSVNQSSIGRTLRRLGFSGPIRPNQHPVKGSTNAADD